MIALVVIGLVVLDLARGERVGVSVDGVEIGNRSADEAAVVVREEIVPPLRRSVIAVRGDHELELAPERSQVRGDDDATVDAAVARSRGGVAGIRGSRTGSESTAPTRRARSASASRGCIRMLIDDVEKLYDQMTIGTPVYIG